MRKFVAIVSGLARQGWLSRRIPWSTLHKSFTKRTLYISSTIKMQQVEDIAEAKTVAEESLVANNKWSMAALLNKEDVSLEAEAVRLQSCEDKLFNSNAHKWCSRCLGGTWAKVPFEKFSVQYIKGGLTNYLYLCSLPDDMTCTENEPKKVLVRIYGEILDNKAKFYEGVIFTLLSERGFGPQLYGVFSSGRIEQYIPSRHLNTNELGNPNLSLCIASKAGKYHSMHLPLNKEPTWLWSSMETWLSVTNVAEFEDTKSEILMEQIRDMNLVQEYLDLKSHLISIGSKVVFCHNDLQERNILLLDNNGKEDVMLIDYEYSSYNYRGSDIGNHFCEWMYDYSNDNWPGYHYNINAYPTAEQQRNFVRQYLKTYNHLKFGSTGEPSEEDIDQLVFEANSFALASHLFWGFWSVVQARVSKIEFGFLEYALARLDAYLIQKKRFWKN